MKLQTLKIAKLAARLLVASLAAIIPVKSMAHDTGYVDAEILVNLLPLLHSHQVYQYGYSSYYPHQIERHHKHHKVRHGHHKHYKSRHGHHKYKRHHQPERVVRSYDRYSDNKIIHKHFK
jgi:hypothetical protein